MLRVAASYVRVTLAASVGRVPPVDVLYEGTLVGTNSSDPSAGSVSVTTGLGRTPVPAFLKRSVQFTSRPDAAWPGLVFSTASAAVPGSTVKVALVDACVAFTALYAASASTVSVITPTAVSPGIGDVATLEVTGPEPSRSAARSDTLRR